MAFFQLSGWISGVHNWVFWIINIKTYKYSIHSERHRAKRKKKQLRYNRILAWWKEYNPYAFIKDSATLARNYYTHFGQRISVHCMHRNHQVQQIKQATREQQTVFIEWTQNLKKRRQKQRKCIFFGSLNISFWQAKMLQQLRIDAFTSERDIHFHRSKTKIISDRIAQPIKKWYDRKKSTAVCIYTQNSGEFNNMTWANKT